MLLYDDLHKAKRFWDSFEEKLASSSLRYIKSDVNKLKLVPLDSNDLKRLSDNFHTCELPIVGISRMKVIGPLFAISKSDTSNSWELLEYLTDSLPDDGVFSFIQRDLTYLSEYIKYYHPEIDKITLPFMCPQFKNDICELKEYSPDRTQLNIS